MVLGIFFTRGVSLKYWVDSGLFFREKIIYEEFIKTHRYKKIIWFTYGNYDSKLAHELKKNKKLSNEIEVVCAPKIFKFSKIGSLLYSFILPFIWNKKINECNVLMTNQIDGWWTAFLASKFFKKKFVLRSGYVQSQLEKKLKRMSKFRIKFMIFSEKLALKKSNHIVFASKHNLKYFQKTNPSCINKATIIPNFIEISKFNSFKSFGERILNNRVLFVGRLSKEKNLFSTIKAFSKLNIGLDVIGEGPLKNDLIQFSKTIKGDVKFLGKIPNDDLPKLYNEYPYYILPSFFEGMPKTLLEAMSCGCICIGSNVVGISQIIKHKENGFLLKKFDSNGIIDTFKLIQKLSLKDCNVICENGINNIKNNYSLKNVSNNYNNIFSKII